MYSEEYVIYFKEISIAFLFQLLVLMTGMREVKSEDLFIFCDSLLINNLLIFL